MAPVMDSTFEGLLPVIHLEDAAAAAVRALTRGKRGASYNIADDHPVSWRELQQAQAVAEGRRFPLALPTWALRASAPFGAEVLTRTSMRLSMTRARRDLGWRPQYPSFADGLRTTVDVAS
jgi:nucleoside-diphosphate-sugar epimerase